MRTIDNIRHYLEGEIKRPDIDQERESEIRVQLNTISRMLEDGFLPESPYIESLRRWRDKQFSLDE